MEMTDGSVEIVILRTVIPLIFMVLIICNWKLFKSTKQSEFEKVW